MAPLFELYDGLSCDVFFLREWSLIPHILGISDAKEIITFIMNGNGQKVYTTKNVFLMKEALYFSEIREGTGVTLIYWDPLPKVIILKHLVFVCGSSSRWDDPPRMLRKALNADR